MSSIHATVAGGLLIANPEMMPLEDRVLLYYKVEPYWVA